MLSQTLLHGVSRTRPRASRRAASRASYRSGETLSQRHRLVSRCAGLCRDPHAGNVRSRIGSLGLHRRATARLAPGERAGSRCRPRNGIVRGSRSVAGHSASSPWSSATPLSRSLARKFAEPRRCRHCPTRASWPAISRWRTHLCLTPILSWPPMCWSSCRTPTSLRMVQAALSKARQALVLVEPGTPAGFERIRHGPDRPHRRRRQTDRALPPQPTPARSSRPTGAISRCGCRDRAITGSPSRPKDPSRTRSSATWP